MNEWIQSAKQSKRNSHIGITLLDVLIVLIVYLLPIGLLIALISDPIKDLLENAFSKDWRKLARAIHFSVIELTMGFGLLASLVLIWTKYVEKRSIFTLGLRLANPVRAYIKGFSIGFRMMAIIWVLLVLTGFAESVALRTLSVILPSMAIVLIGWIVQSATEELLTRGWIMPKVAARYGIFAGVAINVAIFAALHVLNTGISVIAIVNLILIGVFFSIYAIKEGSIIGVSAIHAAWNFTQANVFGFVVSGMKSPGGTIVRSTLDNNIWSGGKFGPEGGLICTLVIVAALIWVKYKK